MDTPQFARDMDLIRAVIVWAAQGGDRLSAPPAEPMRLAYHVWLALDAGLLGEQTLIAFGPPPGRAVGKVPLEVLRLGLLTNKGQDALEVMRRDTVWEKTKAALGERALPLMLDFALAVAKGIAAQHGIPLD